MIWLVLCSFPGLVPNPLPTLIPSLVLLSGDTRSGENIPESVEHALKHSKLLPPLHLVDDLLHPLVHPRHQVKLSIVLQNFSPSPSSKRSCCKSRRNHPTQGAHSLKCAKNFKYQKTSEYFSQDSKNPLKFGFFWFCKKVPTPSIESSTLGEDHPSTLIIPLY